MPQPSPPSGLGLGAPWQSGDNVPAMLETLRPAWWYDWRFEQAGSPGYVPMIWSGEIWHQNDATLTSLFERRPDLFWLLWNEPERSDQANMGPDEAATLTAEIAAHGIQYAAPGVALTGDGYRWLEDYLRHGGPVPHMWHVHIYGCMTPAQWSLRWASWVGWMHDRNVVRPTIVSETNGWTEGDYGQRAMMDHVATMLGAPIFSRPLGGMRRSRTCGATVRRICCTRTARRRQAATCSGGCGNNPDYQRQFSLQNGHILI